MGKKLIYVSSALLFILSAGIIHDANAQQKPESQIAFELGVQHYDKEEYEQALHYFEKAYSKTNNPVYYDYLLKSYITVGDLKKAEKTAKKRIKKSPGNPNYIFKLGEVYAAFEEFDKSKQQFEKAINSLTANQNQIINLANKFVSINELDFAEKTYLKGRKLLRKDYPLNFNLAHIYQLKQEYGAMINEYLELIEFNDGYIQSVQNALQTALNPDPKNEKKDLLRQELLKKIQKKPNQNVFPEMLIWLYVQEKDFEGAFIQAKALDKRNNESGNRIMSLANLSRSNKDYDLAIKCYEYLIAKGPETFRYQSAKIELVEVLNQKIIESTYSPQDLTTLENEYKATLKEFGKNQNTVALLKGMAHLQGFYLNKQDSAIVLLLEAIKIPRIAPQQKAQCKIELADIYLLSNEIWEASLLYSQVEKEFKYDQLGESAKFKNAKVFYYSGDFKWAKAQLDVLKGSTSKLIANDAMALSLLITDNTTIDTLTIPLLKFAQADLLLVQNKTDEVLNLLDTIDYLFPTHTLHDEVLFKRYEVYRKKRDYKKAAQYLNDIYEYDPTDILADKALFLLAVMQEEIFEDKEKAMKLYKSLMLDHNDSIHVTEARKRFRELRGDQIN